jgi:hypothetical protein
MTRPKRSRSKLATRHSRRLPQTDPLSWLRPQDRCWCGDDRAYSECHGGKFEPSLPGAPVPASDDSGIWVSPTMKMEPHVLESMLSKYGPGVPIFASPPGSDGPPPVRPQLLSRLARAIAQLPAAVPTLTLPEIGRQRFEVLHALGLDRLESLEARAQHLSPDDLGALAHMTIDLARATLDRLREQAAQSDRPTVISTDDFEHVTTIIGKTLLWADHYLTPDDVLDLVSRGNALPSEVVRALRPWLEHRQLLELGVVVPVADELAMALVESGVQKRTEALMARPSFRNWIRGQLMMEGPTARDVLLINAKDDSDKLGAIFFYGMEVPELRDTERRTTQFRFLGQYEPKHDYSSWIQQSRDSGAIALVRKVINSVATAELFAGKYITTSPFHVRVMMRDNANAVAPVQSLVWTDVPTLPSSSAEALAAVAQEDAAVEAMRNTVRRTFSKIEDDADWDRRIDAARDVAAEIAEDCRQLEETINRERRWMLTIPTAVTVASIGLAAAAGNGPLGVVSGALAGLATLLPLRARELDYRKRIGYGLLIGRRRSKA